MVRYLALGALLAGLAAIVWTGGARRRRWR